MVDQPAPQTDAALDPVIAAYKKDVDRTLLRENLKLTADERLRKLQEFVNSIGALRGRAEAQVRP